MFSLLSSSVLAILLSPLISLTSAQNTSTPIAHLPYGTFAGAYSPTYNLTHFRRIPFGASTAGPNRFRAPQPPLPINGTYNSDRTFDMCPQRTVNGSEDCLYLGLYSRPWTTASPLRPVLVTFYGGGFIRGDASMTIPPSGFPVLNASESNDYVVVYPNYRTNVFGFLPGRKIGESERVDLNPGLLDQQAALLWVQKHIRHFGGDASNVVIWGQSAGGGSVVAQTIATGNKDKGLFKRAMVSSPFWPKTYRYDAPEAEAIFDAVSESVGCTGSADEVQCLQKADLQQLRDVALALTNSHVYNTSSFTWSPVIDTSFLTTPLSTVIATASLNTDTILTSYNLHEGENFIPPGFSSNTTDSVGFNSSSASFDAWLSGFLPDFTADDLIAVETLYPASGSAEEMHYNTTSIRAGLVLRDLVLACPAYWLSSTAAATAATAATATVGGKGWVMEYTISPAKHASDTIYWNAINAVQKTDVLTYEAYTGAMASFVQTGDPNQHKMTNASVVGVPGVGERKQFVVGKSGVAAGGIGMLEERCAFWLGMGGKASI
ncbi:alpha/beta-hydrolase [Pleomassaria siparia CBS 279.74]|uniref:Carboxylic ester hydrolase n=1 Tax=Pleomassaria siparia CBS 279.74 TaxID=1314801 RepID=A0A6G1K9Q8_9PLEO|nr:alpha/beta-hydrolase [Pleomassaria siparia CBS 279.74]